MPAHLGHGLPPVPGSGMEGAAVGALETGEDMLFPVPHAVFDPAFFIARADMARGNGTAAVGGAVERLRRKHRGFPQRTLEHSGFEGVDQACLGHAAKALKGVWVAGEAVLHGLGDGALDIPHTAVAQHPDKAPQRSAGLPHLDGPQRAPIDLGACARGNGPREKGGRPPGSDRVHRGLDQRRAPRTAGLAAALQHLGGRRGLWLQPADHRLFTGIEFAGAQAWLPRPEVLWSEPIGHGAESEHSCLGEL